MRGPPCSCHLLLFSLCLSPCRPQACRCAWTRGWFWLPASLWRCVLYKGKGHLSHCPQPSVGARLKEAGFELFCFLLSLSQTCLCPRMSWGLSCAADLPHLERTEHSISPLLPPRCSPTGTLASSPSSVSAISYVQSACLVP